MDVFTGGQVAERFHFDGLRSSSLRFADDVVLLASSCGGLSIYGLIYILTFFCIHELWVVTEKNKITDTRVAGPSHLSRRLQSPTWGGVLGISFEEETLGYMQGTLERLCLSTGPRAAPTDGLEQVAQEKKVWASLIKLLRPSPRYVGSDGWMRSL